MYTSLTLSLPCTHREVSAWVQCGRGSIPHQFRTRSMAGPWSRNGAASAGREGGANEGGELAKQERGSGVEPLRLSEREPTFKGRP